MLIAMAAGFIMGQVYAFFLITMVAVSLVGLYIADINDLLPTPIHPLTTARSLLFQMMNLALISVVIGYTTRLLHTYRQRHRQQQDELAENNRLLESHRATLERQVQERTAAILEQKQYFEALMQHSPLAIVALDQELRVVAINEAFEKLFGYEPADAIGHLLDSLVATTETMTEALDYTQRVLAGERIIGSGKRRRKDGSEVEVDLYGVPVIVDDQQVGILGLYQDVSARKQSEERLQYLATHDLLTELPNRFLYTDRLNQALAKAECNGYHFAVFFLDLDGFKDVNDTFGHMKGDIILREVAQRLMSCVRQSDTLARLGGDEFSYIIEDVQDLQTTGGISQKILAALARPFYVDGNPVTITASIGISIYPLDGNTADDLLKKADAAMYQAKDLGGNTFVFCSQLATDKL
jgi:diguanylate cyclase (GGDEF)-like protein/PAS domain S-box-containing protein